MRCRWRRPGRRAGSATRSARSEQQRRRGDARPWSARPGLRAAARRSAPRCARPRPRSGRRGSAPPARRAAPGPGARRWRWPPESVAAAGVDRGVQPAGQRLDDVVGARRSRRAARDPLVGRRRRRPRSMSRSVPGEQVGVVVGDQDPGPDLVQGDARRSGTPPQVTSLATYRPSRSASATAVRRVVGRDAGQPAGRDGQPGRRVVQVGRAGRRGRAPAAGPGPATGARAATSSGTLSSATIRRAATRPRISW